MITTNSQTTDNLEIPPYHRIVRAASNREEWNLDELRRRDATPRWLILECQAHIELLLFHTDQPSRIAKFDRVFSLLDKVPSPKVRDSAIELLNAMLPDSDHLLFPQLYRERSDKRGEPELPEPSAADKRVTWPRLRSGPAYFVYASLLTLAATILIFMFFADANVPKKQNQLIARDTVIKSGWMVAEDQQTKGTPNPDLNAGEVITYDAGISTSQKFATLLSMDYEPSHTRLSSKENDRNKVEFLVQYKSEPKNYCQYFIIVVSDDPIFAEPTVHENWLAKVALELQKISSRDDPDGEKAEAVFLRELRSSGYDKEVVIHIDRIVCHDVR